MPNPLPAFAKTVRKHRAEGFGWRYNGVDDWPTERIFEQLRQLGIDTDEQRFPEQAASAGGFNELDDAWVGQMRESLRDNDFWEDFPFIGIPVLWVRLAPHIICADLIQERLQRVVTAEDEGEDLPDIGGVPADLAAALELARFLQAVEPSQRPTRFAKVNEGPFYDFAEWLVELINRRGKQFPDAVAQIADVMSECCREHDFQAELAMSLAAAGHAEDAVARATAYIERFPNDFWVRIRAGDVFATLGDDARAVERWREALLLGDGHEHWQAATQRLENILVHADREAELDEILRRYPEPQRPYVAPAPSPPQPAPPALAGEDSRNLLPTAPLKAAPKIGRNDPCPCGSGKKYKKCCLR